MKKVIYTLLAFSPVLALADVSVAVGTAKTLAQGFKDIVNMLIPALFALAILYFFWGIAKYILSAGDPDKAKEGKSIMIYGVIAIAVMAALYGVVNFVVSSTIGGTTGGTLTAPVVQ